MRSTLRKVSSLLFCLLFANSVWADSVLIIHQNYSSVHSNVGGRLTNEGHSVTYSTSEVSDLSSYDQVWDVRYGSLSSTQAGYYDTFVKNGGFVYLVTENPSCCGTRNNAVASLISNMGGGSGLTIGGSAGSTSNTITDVNTTYMTALSSGTTITFAAGSAITNYGNGQWLLKDANGKVAGVMWAGGAGDLDSDYTGTVITVADINWLDSTRFSGTNITALDDIISGIVYGTVQGTISDSGNTGGSATPIFSSGITSTQSTKRSSKLSDTASHGMEAHVNITGGSNTVDIDQHDAAHYLELTIIGNSNTVDIDQEDPAGVATHFGDVVVEGNSNTLDLLQTGSGSKTAFIGIDGNSNTVDVIQKDSGQHYLQLDLIGDGHDATILQEGSGSHDATIELENGGGAWDFNLNQKGTTDKEYSLPHSMSDGSTTSGTCYVAAGCSLTVIQDD